jgi:hypothetical protein
VIPIEVKPIVQRDPLRRAYVQVIDPLNAKLHGLNFGLDYTSASHLRWMCIYLLQNIDTMNLDKAARWVGFIQGVMAANGVLDVTTERDRTRPIFTAAYDNKQIFPE